MWKNEKPLFIYQEPHYVHAEWGRSVNCKFINFRLHRRFRKLRLARILTRVLLNFVRKPKFVIAEGGAPLAEAALVKIMKNVPMMYLVADVTPYRVLKGDEYLKELTELSDLIVATSKMVLDDTLKCCRIKKYSIVYPFVRDCFFNYRELNRRAEKDKRKGVFVGVLSAFKGAHMLSSIAGEIRKRVAGFKLVTIGKMDDIKLKENDALKPLGYISTSMLMREVSEAKVYIHPAIYDPFSVSVAEAVVLGTIPIVTNRTGIKEFLPKDLVAKSVDDLIEKSVYVLGLSRDSYEDLLLRIRKNIEPKIRKEFSIDSFKTSCCSLSLKA